MNEIIKELKQLIKENRWVLQDLRAESKRCQISYYKAEGAAANLETVTKALENMYDAWLKREALAAAKERKDCGIHPVQQHVPQQDTPAAPACPPDSAGISEEEEEEEVHISSQKASK